ncbi:MAG: EAL domain-containing protein [Acidimicrobiia bacterium]
MRRSRILVVDDDADVRALIAATLELEDLDVETAADGRTALARLDSEPFDVVLLDRMMPGMDGFEVLAAIRADPRLSLLPVLLVTGLGGADDAVASLDRGADDHIAKPFSPDELAARVRAQLRGQRAWVDRLTATVARRRSVLAEAAAAAGAAGTTDRAASALCDALLAESELVGIEVLEVPGGHVRRLGGAGAPCLEVLRLAGTDDLDALHAGLPAGPRRIDLPDQVLCAAPVRDGASTLAVVLAAGEPGVRHAAADAVLALTIDAAAMAAGILAEPLRASRLRAAEQDRIRAIVEDRAFHPVFQPIIDLVTDTVVGHEALSRFEGGLDPAEVFGSAVRVGVAAELEQATMQAAVDAAERQPAGCWLALNVSPSCVIGPLDLDAVLRPAGARDIVLEISEMEPVADYEALHGAIDGLRPAVQLSVDDAGAGFASLAHILALHARYVKLDRSWVQGIDVDPAKRALVAGLQSFAEETGATIIAEGIETEAQLEVVRRLGIACGQGWLLGRPGPLPST